jgi:transaldolase
MSVIHFSTANQYQTLYCGGKKMRNEWLTLREKLIFRTDVKEFANECSNVREKYKSEFNSASSDRKSEIIDIISELTIDLQSYLKKWHLQKYNFSEKVSDKEIEKQAAANYELLKSWGAQDKVKYVKDEVAQIAKSNMMKLSIMADEGKISNRWGNDYASNLAEVMRKGAILATTNPPIINNERKENPELWDKVKANLKKEFPQSTSTQLASIMTMQVVLKNCREIRPVYEASEGKYGYISLQVNPKNSTDSNKMVEEVKFLYEQLRKELKGTPNVVFKLPGTEAALEAAKRLTADGIGVNITLCFSVDQHKAFAEVIEKGNAKVSFVVNMAGRLDDPIKEELAGLGVEDAAEIAKWASTAVTRKSYRLLYKELKLKKSTILVASLRGAWNIEGSLADGDTKILITSFPDKTLDYDSVERQIVSHISDEIPQQIMEKLMKSKIFRKAYQIDKMSPKDFDSFYPVVKTLNSFAKSYDEFVEYMEN